MEGGTEIPGMEKKYVSWHNIARKGMALRVVESNERERNGMDRMEWHGILWRGMDRSKRNGRAWHGMA